MQTTSIFTFDHGQKKLNKAIGVEESYMDELQEKLVNVLKDHIFDEDRNIKDDLSPSILVETTLHEFSYSQLVIMASFYLQDKLEGFTQKIEEKLKGITKSVKSIALDADDIPPHIKDMLMEIMKDGEGDSKTTAIDADSLPKEIKDFLDKLTQENDDDGDDD